LQQKEKYKELHTQIKQLKQSLWHAQLPQWEQQVETIDSIPFLFLALKNMGQNELRNIVLELSERKPGFYFIMSNINNRVIFYSILSDQLTNRLNLENFASWLKEEHGLRCGGSKNTLQGGGDKFDANLGDAIKTWIKQQQS